MNIYIYIYSPLALISLRLFFEVANTKTFLNLHLPSSNLADFALIPVYQSVAALVTKFHTE